MEAILVLNAGSSSLKFQIFALTGADPEMQVKGQIDGIGVRPHFKASDRAGTVLADGPLAAEEAPDLPAATQRLQGWLGGLAGFQLVAVGHRVVHGGTEFAAPVRIDDAVLQRLQRYETLAPLHQPNNLAPIRLVQGILPDLPQVACFDTAFHRSHPAVADAYAIPRHLHDDGIRRYGFHGLSYDYIAHRLPQVAPDLADARVVVAHLGSGVSMCAIKGGKSVESTMGFTALDGMVMGTRPGQLDPGVVLHLFQHYGMTAAEVSDLLYKQSGLKGLSGISNDMRDLLDSPDPRAAFAVECFVHRAAMAVAGLAAAMDGIDALVFTAGIGENAPPVRAAITRRLAWLGADLDGAQNDAGGPVISTRESRLSVLVIPTNEELMIARQTLAVVKGETP